MMTTRAKPNAEVILLRDAGGERDWAALSFLGRCLLRSGHEVERVHAAPQATSDDRPGALPGDLVVRPRAGDASGLARTLEGLRDAPPFVERLKNVAIEVVTADRLHGLETAPLGLPRIALFGGAGAPFHHLDILASTGIDAWPIASARIRAGGLAGYDALVVPGGGWEFMEGQLCRMGTEGVGAIRAFVEGGGGLLTSCAGTSSTLRIAPAFVDNWHPAQSLMPKLSATSWLTSDENPSGSRSPGIGVIQVRLAETRHPLTLGLPEKFPCVYYNGPILEGTGSDLHPLLLCEAPDPERFTPGECLYGEPDLDLGQTAMARACAAGLPAAGWQAHGEGVIVGYGLHPEFGPEPSMRHWGQAARLIENAAEWMHRRRPPSARAQSDLEMPAAVVQAVGRARGLARELGSSFARLAATRLEPLPPWLGTDQARAAFGLDPVAIWRLTTTTGAEGCEAMDRDLDAWQRAFEAPWSELGAAHQRAEIAGARARAALLLTLGNVEDGAQDLGFKGLIALLEEALALTTTFEVAGAHHPYRAVAMSYLSAFGLFVAAQLVLSASRTLLDQAALIAAVAQGPCSTNRPQ